MLIPRIMNNVFKFEYKNEVCTLIGHSIEINGFVFTLFITDHPAFEKYGMTSGLFDEHQSAIFVSQDYYNTLNIQERSWSLTREVRHFQMNTMDLNFWERYLTFRLLRYEINADYYANLFSCVPKDKVLSVFKSTYQKLDQYYQRKGFNWFFRKSIYIDYCLRLKAMKYHLAA